MKKILTIATFNFQNQYHPFLTLKDKTNCYSFVKFILENDIDILGTQETLIRNLRLCYNVLSDHGYTIYGDGRLGRFGSIYPISLANETNSIIFKNDLGKGITTFRLPSFGVVFPRIVTKAEFGDVVFLNTHLDNVNNKLKCKQLLFIKRIIRELVNENKYIILTGDFNMTIKNRNFKDFVNSLKLLGIKRVDANENSCKGVNFGPLDHVFIPNDWEVLEVLQPLVSISDHNPIVVKVKTNI